MTRPWAVCAHGASAHTNGSARASTTAGAQRRTFVTFLACVMRYSCLYVRSSFNRASPTPSSSRYPSPASPRRPGGCPSACVRGFDVIGLLGLPLQDRVEAVEDRHPTLEQLMIVLCALRKPFNGEVEADRLVPRELAIVQVGFVDHLGDHFDTAVLHRAPLDPRLARTVLAVMP